MVVHTAGPYAGEQPAVLRAAIEAQVPVYVDLSDPVEYLDAAQALDGSARAAGTLALCAAGAFPGLSNVLAMECVERLGKDAVVQDMDFNYFTAGLGGSGEVNLLITNEGFGDPVPIYRDGAYTPQLTAGGGLRRVKFFLSEEEPSFKLVGEKTVWDWPFPEGKLVPRQLGGIRGGSSVGMGTAPELWNLIMGAMCAAVPRDWWRRRAFSQGLASFSRPLVALTDRFVGETHAMRIDVTATDGTRATVVQSHESFRCVVGQCCAEFACRLLDESRRANSAGAVAPAAEAAPLPAAAGVWLPEGLFASPEVRKPMLERLLAVPGTLNVAFEVSEMESRES